MKRTALHTARFAAAASTASTTSQLAATARASSSSALLARARASFRASGAAARPSVAIRRPALYAAVTEAARVATVRGTAPTRAVLPAERVYRAVPRQYYRSPSSGLFVPADSDVADGNRWNGMRASSADGPGNAALYTGAWDAVRAEVHHYRALRDANVETLRAIEMGAVSTSAVDVHAFTAQPQVVVALGPTAPAYLVDVAAMLPEIASNREVLRELRGMSAEEAMASEDYSFARAVSHGVFDANAGYAGLVAPTARAILTAPASNMVFFSTPEQAPPLRPMAIYNVRGLRADGRVHMSVRDVASGDVASSAMPDLIDDPT